MYWVDSKTSWSKKDVVLIEDNSQNIVIWTKHLSMFAVIESTQSNVDKFFNIY